MTTLDFLPIPVQDALQGLRFPLTEDQRELAETLRAQIARKADPRAPNFRPHSVHDKQALQIIGFAILALDEKVRYVEQERQLTDATVLEVAAALGKTPTETRKQLHHCEADDVGVRLVYEQVTGLRGQFSGPQQATPIVVTEIHEVGGEQTRVTARIHSTTVSVVVDTSSSPERTLKEAMDRFNKYLYLLFRNTRSRADAGMKTAMVAAPDEGM